MLFGVVLRRVVVIVVVVVVVVVGVLRGWGYKGIGNSGVRGSFSSCEIGEKGKNLNPTKKGG